MHLKWLPKRTVLTDNGYSVHIQYVSVGEIKTEI